MVASKSLNRVQELKKSLDSLYDDEGRIYSNVIEKSIENVRNTYQGLRGLPKKKEWVAADTFKIKGEDRYDVPEAPYKPQPETEYSDISTGVAPPTVPVDVSSVEPKIQPEPSVKTEPDIKPNLTVNPVPGADSVPTTAPLEEPLTYTKSLSYVEKLAKHLGENGYSMLNRAKEKVDVPADKGMVRTGEKALGYLNSARNETEFIEKVGLLKEYIDNSANEDSMNSSLNEDEMLDSEVLRLIRADLGKRLVPTPKMKQWISDRVSNEIKLKLKQKIDAGDKYNELVGMFMGDIESTIQGKDLPEVMRNNDRLRIMGARVGKLIWDKYLSNADKLVADEMLTLTPKEVYEMSRIMSDVVHKIFFDEYASTTYLPNSFFSGNEEYQRTNLAKMEENSSPSKLREWINEERDMNKSSTPIYIFTITRE